MDHTQHTRLEPAELNQHNLVGATVYDTSDETVGEISHMHGTGSQSHVVLDVGGFLGIGAKQVALRLADLDVMRDASGTIHAITPYSKDQVKALPEHVDP